MRTRRLITAGTLAAGLAIAGCGSGSSTPASAAVIAHKLGCVGYSAAGLQATPWTRQDATCSFWSGGKSIEIVTFANRKNENTWVGYPGSGVDVSGSLWAVTVSNEEQASKVVSLLGGTAH